MTTKHLIATFSTTVNHVHFIMRDSAGADAGTDHDITKDVAVTRDDDNSTTVEGPAQGVMQIIGHFAAHGEDCLVSVRPGPTY